MPDDLTACRPTATRQYTPLCLLSVARSGTNLLLNLLNNHPDIVVHGECFNSFPATRGKSLLWKHLPCPPYTTGPYGDYALTYIYPAIPTGKQVVGFKLFPHQLWKAPEGDQIAFNTIRSMQGFKAILLIRDNILDVALSQEIAEQTRVWSVFESQMPTCPPSPVLINYHTLIDRMNYVLKQQENARRMSKELKVKYIRYNDLVQNTDQTLADIQTWLGVNVLHLRPERPIRKQRTIPRHLTVSNFKELHDRCISEHPEWKCFFEETERLIEV